MGSVVKAPRRLGDHDRGGSSVRPPPKPARPDEAGDRRAGAHGQNHDGQQRDRLGDERALAGVLHRGLRAAEEVGQLGIRRASRRSGS